MDFQVTQRLTVLNEGTALPLRKFSERGYHLLVGGSGCLQQYRRVTVNWGLGLPGRGLFVWVAYARRVLFGFPPHSLGTRVLGEHAGPGGPAEYGIH